ncbi:RadC family protein [Acetobacter lambici]|uniref:DNA repair protein RadC n=1 Tax=Acetobacter lambici TaxID=1332824 RepID=A0ABT1EW62_9PROT|nr:DNA repair protein RadC [Acetobacter lambici]
MSSPPTQPGVADGAAFFIAPQDGLAQIWPVAKLEQVGADDQHCLAALLGAAGMADIPAREQAVALVAEYGTLSALLLAASQQEGSVRLLPESVRVLLILALESIFRLYRARLMRGSVLCERPALNAYLLALMARDKTEQMRVLFLDTANRLVADEVMGRGTVDHAPVYPREIVRRALALRAGSFVLVHNHPSGDATPSAEDISMTGQIIAAARIVGLHVADHLIVGKEQVLSMKEAGLL